MAKLLIKSIFNIKPLGFMGKSFCKGLHSTIPVKEIKIPVPWGHIAGKWWGSEQKIPVLAIHGWQDNCGTWDPLARLISDKISILAIDLPGHGHSSWMPPGFAYKDAWEAVSYVITIKNFFKWNKISILGHSLGSVVGLRYAGLYPDVVDMCILVENVVLQDTLDFAFTRIVPKTFQKKVECQNPLIVKETHVTMEELTDRLYINTQKSIKRENLQYLMKRGARQISEEPNKFLFSRDIRLKYDTSAPINMEFLEKLIKRISFPLLYLKATDSFFKPYDQYCLRVQEILKKNNPNFESHIVDGTHHVHLNNPEIIQPIIVDFLRKHKFIDE